MFLLVGVTILAQAAGTARAQGARACKPVASVDGPSPMVAQIRAILDRHDVRSTPDPSCSGRVIRARIEALRDGTGYTMTTTDEEGRTSARVFFDAATAASLIESWATEESDPLLATLPVVAAVSAPPPPPPPRMHLAAGLETALGRDGSWWIGVSLGACARAGPLCIGARVRSTQDLDLLGASKSDLWFRNGFETLLTTSWPLNYRRLFLAPTVGLGFGWLRTITEGGLREDAATLDDRHLRVEASLLGKWPAESPVALAIEAGASWSPRARTADRRIGNMILLAEPSGYLRLTVLCLVTL